MNMFFLAGAAIIAALVVVVLRVRRRRPTLQPIAAPVARPRTVKVLQLREGLQELPLPAGQQGWAFVAGNGNVSTLIGYAEDWEGGDGSLSLVLHRPGTAIPCPFQTDGTCAGDEPRTGCPGDKTELRALAQFGW